MFPDIPPVGRPTGGDCGPRPEPMGNGEPIPEAEDVLLPLPNACICGRPMRVLCSARAFAIRSAGNTPADGGGLRALVRVPVTVDVDVIAVVDGSETVRRDGTRFGRALGDGGSSGVLASESSSTMEHGEVGMLSNCSSGVAGTELSRPVAGGCCDCDIMRRGGSGLGRTVWPVIASEMNW